MRYRGVRFFNQWFSVSTNPIFFIHINWFQQELFCRTLLSVSRTWQCMLVFDNMYWKYAYFGCFTSPRKMLVKLLLWKIVSFWLYTLKICVFLTVSCSESYRFLPHTTDGAFFWKKTSRANSMFSKANLHHFWHFWGHTLAEFLLMSFSWNASIGDSSFKHFSGFFLIHGLSNCVRFKDGLDFGNVENSWKCCN